MRCTPSASESEPGKFDPEVLERLRASRPVQGWEYVRALKERARLQAEFARLFQQVDVLALPAVAITAPALQQRSVAGPGSAGVRETLLGLTNPWNVLGLPAISLPAGWGERHAGGLATGGRGGRRRGPAGAGRQPLASAAGGLTGKACRSYFAWAGRSGLLRRGMTGRNGGGSFFRLRRCRAAPRMAWRRGLAGLRRHPKIMRRRLYAGALPAIRCSAPS